jgi:ubiquinone/menaquinone biosynthesis C-methylase UbiE
MPLPGRPGWSWLLGTRLRRWRMRRTLRAAVEHVPSGASVLDAGSGPGYDAEELARLLPAAKVRRWVLLDPQRLMLLQAGRIVIRRQPDADRWAAVVGDAAAIPARDSSFDLVLSLGVLCCMSEMAVAKAITETVRVLRPGGWLVFGVPPWRRAQDLESFERLGLVVVARPRRGGAILQKRA